MNVGHSLAQYMLTLPLLVIDNSSIREQSEGGEEVEDRGDGLGEHGDGQRVNGIRGENERNGGYAVARGARS